MDDLTDDLVWTILALPGRERRQAAREAGTNLSLVVIRAKQLLKSPEAWAEYPVECRRFAEFLERRRSQGSVAVRR